MLRKKSLYSVMVACLCIVLSGCGAYDAMMKPQKGAPAIDQIDQSLNDALRDNAKQDAASRAAVPNSVNAGLLPDLSIQGQQQGDTGKRFDVSVNNVPAREFFLGLVKGTKYNVVVSPKVTGNITLNLNNVTVPEVLSATKDLYGYQYKKTPYGYHIMPAGLRTQIFKVNYLDVIRKGKSHTAVSSGQVVDVNTANNSTTTTTTGSNSTEQKPNPSSTVETETENNFWKAMKETITAIVGDAQGAKIVVNQDAGLVVVTATPDILKNVSQYLDSVQDSVDREVLIDAKILEVSLYSGYQAGINWNLLGMSQMGLGATGDGDIAATGNTKINDSLEAFTNVFTLHIGGGDDFDALIHLLSTQGQVQVLSSPRIATMNNQKAVIKVGQDEYFVTNVTNTTVTSTSTENSQDVEIQPFFSGVALDVTPEISGKGQVVLHLHPIVSSVKEHDITYKVGDSTQEIPSALTSVRESDTIVRAKNKQVVVIGGLMSDDTSEVNASTPFLGKVPVVGPLFRRANQQAIKTELVIILRPVMIDGDSNTAALKDAQKAFHKMNRGFMFGSHPETFGNLGEPSIQAQMQKGKGSK